MRLFKTDIRILQACIRDGGFSIRKKPQYWTRYQWNLERTALDRLLSLELISVTLFTDTHVSYVVAGQ